MQRHQRGMAWECAGGKGNSSGSVEGILGSAVRERREKIGMTQMRLAELSGMTQAAISRLEHGKCMPTFPLLERIAGAFGSALTVGHEQGL